MNRRIVTFIVAATIATVARSQSGTNSPYSQYGLGMLSDQTSGFNRGMNGLGIAFRESNQVNFINPASYSSVDSLSFIFDMGLSAQVTNFKENGVSKNARNGSIEYVVATFRAMRHVGVSFGVVPFTNVGYNYSSTGFVDNTRTATYTNSYNGSGGLHQAYLGVGVELFKGFSLGVNGSYLWGDIDRTVSNTYSDAYFNQLTKAYSTSVSNYRVDLGMQYAMRLGTNDVVTLGATYGVGHKLGADAVCRVTSVNSQTSVSTTTTYTAPDALEMPTTIGGGLSWAHKQRLKVGVDYSLQQWADVGFPVVQTVGNTTSYSLNSNYFDNRHKATIGGEWCRNPQSRRWLDRVRLRAGASYATSYYKVNGADGPHEISVSAGFGLPFSNAVNSYMVRPVLNISGQWVQQSAPGLIRENTFRINVGLTFNERWFAKWKVD